MEKLFKISLLCFILLNVISAQNNATSDSTRQILKNNIRISAGFNYSSFGSVFFNSSDEISYDYESGYKIGITYNLCKNNYFGINASLFYTELKSVAYELSGKTIYDKSVELTYYDLYFKAHLIEIPVSIEYPFIKNEIFNVSFDVGFSLVIALKDMSDAKNYKCTGRILYYYPEDYIEPLDYTIDNAFTKDNSGSSYHCSINFYFYEYHIALTYENYLIKFKNLDLLHSYSIVFGYEL